MALAPIALTTDAALQDNVALIAVLEATEAPGRSVNGDRRQLVCVANTHVHSNPELTDVKLWQARAFRATAAFLR